MATIDPTAPEGRAHIRAIAVDAPTDRAVLLTQENVAQLLDAIDNAAHDALDGLIAHADTQSSLSATFEARDAWNSVSLAAHDYQDTHHPRKASA